MSFLFGGSSKSTTKEEIDQVFQAINGIEESQQAKFVTNLTLSGNDLHGYYKLNVLDFFTDQYANVRPKNLEIVLNNYNEDMVENVDVYYLHTPIRDEDLDVTKLSQFANHFQFVKKTTIKNPQPYLTFCQVSDEGEITDVDISQTTNVNLVPGRTPFMSLGALIFQLNRRNSGDVTIEMTVTMTYTIKKL